jgi:hypothetical protein
MDDTNTIIFEQVLQIESKTLPILPNILSQKLRYENSLNS